MTRTASDASADAPTLAQDFVTATASTSPGIRTTAAHAEDAVVPAHIVRTGSVYVMRISGESAKQGPNVEDGG